MKKALGTMAMMMMATAMMGGGNDMFDFREHRNPYEGETDEERRKRLHKMYGDNSQEHEFVVKDETIMAKDRKTAMKIYAKRHPEKKKGHRK